MQAVCDSQKRIRDGFIGFPGSVHDARVFRVSPLFHSLREKCQENCILADSAYPCLRNVLTPYRDTGNLGEIERHYNYKLSHCRIAIEHTFGMLKQKFRQLYHLKLRDIPTMCHFIRACCVLYNLTLGIQESEEELNVINPGEHEAIEEDNPENIVGQNYRNYVATALFNNL